ncbi:Serine carboxypeptidase-like [Arachis hypogaea]|nr:Serine carboxypeptidase-like [Arachis hypogaea]
MNMLRERRHSSVRIATLLSSNCYSDNHGVLLLLLLLLLQISSQLANCGSIVKFLPGFQGPLPFVLETGYIGVGENEDVQAFYYFVESENNPKVDPLMLWLTGGPGCSAFSGLVLKLDHLDFKMRNIMGACLIWSTGHTHGQRSESVTARSDSLLVNQTHQFLRKWLTEHPQFFSNEFFVGGDSYSGIPIPIIVDEISRENEEGVQPWINLQGNLLGNAATTRVEKKTIKSHLLMEWD